MKCKQCSKEFEPKRATALYCSAKCRKLAFQNKGLSVPDVSVPGLSVPDNEPDVTLTDDADVTLTEPELSPLDVYSPARWASLKAKGYSMPDGRPYDGQLTLDGDIPMAQQRCYARKAVGPGQYQWALPVPGDPVYELEHGVCQTCGKATPIKAVTRCGPCCWGKVA